MELELIEMKNKEANVTSDCFPDFCDDCNPTNEQDCMPNGEV